MKNIPKVAGTSDKNLKYILNGWITRGIKEARGREQGAQGTELRAQSSGRRAQGTGEESGGRGAGGVGQDAGQGAGREISDLLIKKCISVPPGYCLSAVTVAVCFITAVNNCSGWQSG